MSHCFSIEVDGVELCTTHVPGNEKLKKDIESGKIRDLTEDEVNRALKFHESQKRKKKPKEDLEDILK